MAVPVSAVPVPVPAPMMGLDLGLVYRLRASRS